MYKFRKIIFELITNEELLKKFLDFISYSLDNSNSEKQYSKLLILKKLFNNQSKDKVLLSCTRANRKHGKSYSNLKKLINNL